MTHLPDISLYRLNKVIHDVDLEGVPVPGLTGNFYRRPDAARTGTAGVYLLAGQELFISWGYADEAHCAWTAYRTGRGWTIPHQGCPRIDRDGPDLILDTGVSLIRLTSLGKPTPDPARRLADRVGRGSGAWTRRFARRGEGPDFGARSRNPPPPAARAIRRATGSGFTTG